MPIVMRFGGALSVLAGAVLLWPCLALSQTPPNAPVATGTNTPRAKPVEPKHPSPGKTAVAAANVPLAHPAPAPPSHRPGAPAPVVPAPAPEPPKKEAAKELPKVGSVTGLPLPRFAALRSDDVNLRVGPGTRYPIGWVYKRRDLPVEIEREYEVWRLVADPDGNRGWVHQATLTGRRSFIVRGETRTMRRNADDNAAAVAVLKPGVVGRVINCPASSTWCEVQVSDYRGYLHRDAFWGTFPGEAVN